MEIWVKDSLINGIILPMEIWTKTLLGSLYWIWFFYSKLSMQSS